jgi:lysophospholipase L1-like esterase
MHCISVAKAKTCERMRSLSFYRLLLAPVLLAQGRKTRQTALRLPEACGERIGRVQGESNLTELRLLFVGDSTMAGVGVRQQTEALASQTAANVARQLDRSVHWQLVAKSGVNASQARSLLERTNVLPADVLITALGTNDVISQTPPRRFVEEYERLLESMLVRASFTVVNGLPPLHITPALPQPLRWYFGRYALLLDNQLRRWVGLKQDMAFVSLQWASDCTKLAEDGFHPGPALYEAWAALIATQITSHFRQAQSIEGAPCSNCNLARS